MVRVEGTKPWFLPFRQIPRFPAHTYLKNGKTHSQEAESLPPGMPIPDNNILTDPMVSRVATIIFDYVVNPQANSGSRSTLLRQNGDFLSKPEVQDIFREQLTSLIENASDAEKPNMARIGQYKALLEKLGVGLQSITQQTRASEQPIEISRGPRLPERIGGVPETAIRVVNESFAQAYPHAFETVIPVLRQADIIVARDKDVTEFARSLHEYEIHPLRREFDERMKRELNANEPNWLRVWTLRSEPGKPVLYYSGDMRMLDRKLGPYPRTVAAGIAEGVMARLFEHETIHRAGQRGEAFPVAANDPFVRMAFASEDRAIALQSSERARQVLTERRRALMDFAKTHDVYIRIDGARVSLLGADDNGELKVITASGYDLEEGLVDYLSRPVIDAQLAYTRTHYNDLVQESVEGSIQNQLNTSAHYNFGNLLQRIPGYIGMLGLSDFNDMLVQFSQGQIPRLHRARIPHEPYLP